jgi:hypothetical protein
MQSERDRSPVAAATNGEGPSQTSEFGRSLFGEAKAGAADLKELRPFLRFDVLQPGTGRAPIE